MPAHDWTRVDAGIFHAFHTAWIAELHKRLNGGVLPEGYYALPEQHAGRAIADVLTLHAGPGQESGPAQYSPARTGGTAVAEIPPSVRRHRTLQGTLAGRRRSLAVRHVSGHRLVALIEIVSAANKDRRGNIDDFVNKVLEALEAGVHVLVVDLLPPGKFDPHGVHEEVRQQLEESSEPYELPAGEPLTLASYVAGPQVEAYLEHLAAGGSIPDMPLFLSAERYVNIPLETTYQEAYGGMPAFWRDVLEGRPRRGG